MKPHPTIAVAMILTGLIACGCDERPPAPPAQPLTSPNQKVPIDPTVPTAAPPARVADPAAYRWLSQPTRDTLAARFDPPAGYERVPTPHNSFGDWLRHLPLREGRPKVMLHDGSPKRNQAAHLAVIDIDTGTRDLQQCADAVMRLRGEYLFATAQHDAIVFNYTSGDAVPWGRWARGERPRVNGNRVTWSRTTEPNDTHESFRAYMRNIFIYAGSASLEKELQRVDDPSGVRIGDVFIQGGFPGHAVLVVDVAEDPATNHRVFMLAQSFMPAQDIHILDNPGRPGSPWFTAAGAGELRTPEWSFGHADLRRFAPTD